MRLSKVEKLILYALGLFYTSINQPLKEKKLSVQTKKIVFIEVLLNINIGKSERAIYKNLQSLEEKGLIDYQDKKIRITSKGQVEYEKMKKEIDTFNRLKETVQKEKVQRQLQTEMENENTKRFI